MSSPNKSFFFVFLLSFFSTIYTTVGPVVPGQPLWGVTKRVAETTDIIESKVCEIDSQQDVIESKIDAIDPENIVSLIEVVESKVCILDSELDIVESKVCTVSSLIDVVESKVDEIPTTEILSQLDVVESKLCEMDSQLDVIEATGVETLEKVCHIESQQDLIESQQDVIESKIDAIDPENIVSLIEVVESKVCILDSELDIVESKVCTVSSLIDVVESKVDEIPTTEILSQLDVVESKLCEMDSQLDVIEATGVETLEKVCHIESQQDLIESQQDVIESKIDAIDPENIVSLIEVVESKVCILDSELDIVESKVCTVSSLIDVVESKVDEIPTTEILSQLDVVESKVCEIDSQLDVIEATAIDTLAKVCSMDSQLDVIEATAIETLDKVCNIQSQQDVIESKVDAIEESSSQLDVIESKVCEIDSQLDVIEATAIDTLAKVCSMDSQLDVIEATAIETLDKVCHIQSQQDVIESAIEIIDETAIETLEKVCDIQTKVDTLLLCEPGPIQSAGTISASGTYCLANDIAGTITIAASDVILDLNNYQVTQGIVVNGALDRVTIKNGEVAGSGDAILVNGGTTGVTIDNVVVKNAIRGINFNNVTGGTISNCEMTLNTTGLELDNSHKINVKDCVASCNIHAGFDLLSSTTNCFENCKALSTGEGNTNVTDNNVFGFVTADGFGNIFERCIANSTQALTTTDAFSVVAGFALRGTEECSKIIECEAANSMTDIAGVTVPYGIWFEGTVSDLSRIAAASGYGSSGPQIAAWSPDSKYVVIGGDAITGGVGGEMQIFEFDRLNLTLISVAGFFSSVSGVNGISWSPDGRYLAVGGGTLSEGTGDEFQILEFDRESNKIKPITGLFGSVGGLNEVAWSPDGRFIAMGGASLPGSNEFQLVRFDRVTQTISQLGGVFGTVGSVASVDWSFDGRFIAIGGVGISGGSGDQVQILSFDGVNTPTPVAGALGSAGTVQAVRWSPDGRYLTATGSGMTGGSSDNFQILEFDGSSTLTPIVGAFGTGTGLFDSSWSSDGRFIAVGTSLSLSILEFDRGSGTLNTINSISSAGTPRAVPWSPDGRYVILMDGADLDVRNGLNAPQKNAIKNNTIYCNSGTKFTNGIGISGSSVSNMIIQNTAYNNPQNYAFVTNIFNQLFGQVPSDIQNISLVGCDPICQPEDIATLIKQTLFKACDNASQLDVIESAIEIIDETAIEILEKVCDIQTKIDTLLLCEPGPIESAGTISASGTYCLANDIAGTITIAASDVVLDLNNYQVTQGIVVNGGLDRIIIKNGEVSDGGDAILVNGGTTGVTIDNVVVKNAIRGINFNNVTGGTISNCEMTLNTTGLELDNSHKINVKDCVASCNTHAGFDLLSSTTNCFENCKALSTGEGNINVTDNNVFGFVSTDGFGNIFERCIANSTQALTTTDYNSVIAGIAFRGGEECSKIIECEAANSMTDIAGVTVPYGILLENRLSDLATIDTITEGGFSIKWSPDGKYIVSGGSGSTTNNVEILSFDRVNSSLTVISGALGDLGSVLGVDWSPDGGYIAIAGLDLSGGTGDEFQILEFDRANNRLEPIVGALGTAGIATSVNWSPDGKFVAVGGSGLTGGNVQIIQFDKKSNSLNQIAAEVTSLAANVVDWSPDGKFVAVGGDGSSSNEFQILEFDSETSLLTTATGALGTSGVVETIDWSPDGKFLVVGGSSLTGGTGDQLQIFSFDGSNTLIPVASVFPSVVSLFSAFWTSDGQFIVVAGTDITGSEEIAILRFDRGASSLEVLDTLAPGGAVREASWAPDGRYIAFLGSVGRRVIDGLLFPEKNVIKSNTVYCNSGNQCPGGIGISGSSISNMIIQNTAYNNPQNYAFTTNIFNQLFGQAPSDLQNISLVGCDPICQPEDIATLIKQTLFKACTNASQLDGIESQLDVIEATAIDTLAKVCDIQTKVDTVLDKSCDIQTKVDTLLLCEPGPIQSAGTISASGTYCLANDIAGTITIAASDVVLDLNNYQVTQGIIVNGGLDRVTIKNGEVSGTGDAILVNGGTTGVTVENVVVKSAIRGINFNNVTGGMISNCEMTLNTTGLELDNSHKINVINSVASCNTHAGFDLLSSTTNCFENCKALSTGEGNTNVTDNNVFGFVTVNGFGNIFEGCIANSTQALTTTDSDSIIAGFALLGTEGCSKIINSEAANSMTAVSGVTVPYGIFLEPRADQITTVTEASVEGTDGLLDVKWSPDGKYIVAGLLDITTGKLFEYDRENDLAILLATISYGGESHTVQWHPSGQFISIAGENQGSPSASAIFVYQFDVINKTVSRIATFNHVTGVSFVYDSSWSPDGLYVVIAGTSGGSPTASHRVLRFDSVIRSLTEVGTRDNGATTRAVNWSHSQDFIVTGDDDGILHVDKFNRASNVLESVTSITVPISAANINSTKWSPDDKYIAVGTDATGSDLFIYRFENNVLTLVDEVGLSGSNVVNQVDWSSDGRFLAIAQGVGFSSGSFSIYSFNRGTQRLALETNGASSSSSDASTVAWSPDGSLLAGGIRTLETNKLKVLTGLTFPEKNVITHNTVYCNSGNECPGGIGISGSTIQNMIIGNTSYNNPQNYAFAANVYNQKFSAAPSDIQNIALDGCVPICSPDDTNLLVRQNLNKTCDIQTKVDIVLTEIEVVESKVDTLLLCEPGPIESAGTISASGTYCLANDISGTITIAASDVVLDLNNYQVTQGIVVNGGLDRIIIKNGEVSDGGDAILVNGGTTGVTIENVVVKNAIRGINFNNVTGGMIRNCEMTLNTTGLELDNSHKINVKNCVASCNTHAGFDLLSSTTNCFENCKALSTGEGNSTLIDNNVFGFVSASGYGNIFERCIANSTQALSTTDSNSLIAGFAFRGTEGCSKIIECEAANSTSSPNGLTVPYGILLEAVLDQIESVSGALGTAGDVVEIAWSPDGKYVAVAGSAISGGTGDEFQIFEFDRTSNSLTAIVGALGTGGVGRAVSWSPDGKYLAVGGSGLTGSNEVQILEFDRTSNNLTSVAGALGTAGDVNVVAWSPDGRFVAVGGGGLTGSNEVQILEFDRTSNNLTSVAGALGTAGSVETVSWSPDGRFVAVGGSGLTGGDAQILEFIRVPAILTSVAGLTTSGDVNGTSWSSDGKYVALVGDFITGTDSVQIIKFDRATPSMVPVADFNPGGIANSTDWSPNGKFIIVGGAGFTTNEAQILEFDRTSNSLTLAAGVLGTAGSVESVDWAPDGRNIAVGGSTLTGSNELQVLTGLLFPEKNVIKNNTVYCNSGNECPGGIGISGSSIVNLIIGNTAYSNPIPIGANAPIVSSNYQFVTNVFDGNSNSIPNPFQNVKYDGCKASCQTANIVERIDILEFLMHSMIDLLLTHI